MKALFGFHPVRELLRHRAQEVEKVWASASGKRLRAVQELAQRGGVSLEVVASHELSSLLAQVAQASGAGSGAGASVHNGFVAILRASARSDGAVASASASSSDRELIVLLEDIQDPRNLGAILRVCEGAGVGRVLVRDRGSAPMSATTIKASAGAAEYVVTERITNTAQEIERLKDQGFWCYGADAEGEPPWAIDLCGPVVLCLGGEDKGLRSRTRGLCDGLIGLPMRGRVASLNVATAASALLYEALRQRSEVKS